MGHCCFWRRPFPELPSQLSPLPPGFGIRVWDGLLGTAAGSRTALKYLDQDLCYWCILVGDYALIHLISGSKTVVPVLVTNAVIACRLPASIQNAVW